MVVGDLFAAVGDLAAELDRIGCTAGEFSPETGPVAYGVGYGTPCARCDAHVEWTETVRVGDAHYCRDCADFAPVGEDDDV